MQIAALKDRSQGGNERLRRMENLLQQLEQVREKDKEETRQALQACWSLAATCTPPSVFLLQVHHRRC